MATKRQQKARQQEAGQREAGQRDARQCAGAGQASRGHVVPQAA